MNWEAAEKIAKAVLYEGYLLYPYTPLSTKNRQRWTFGGLYPESFTANAVGSDSSELQTEFLVEAAPSARISASVRFLHLIQRTHHQSEPRGRVPPGAGPEDSWEEAREREFGSEDLELGALEKHPVRREFEFEGGTEFIGDIRREQRSIHGRLEISAKSFGAEIWRLTIRVGNRSGIQSDNRSEASLHSLFSTHVLTSIKGGKFHSLIDPPGDFSELASLCRNTGSWPVLVGDEGDTDLMLSAPIILYDYPRVAPESPGDLFDSTEIDEILSLRILTLTDEEKELVRRTDEKGRALLERTENLTGDDLLKLHGTFRDIRIPDRKPTMVRVGTRELKPGDRIRLHPNKTADIFDLALKGTIGTVDTIEQDYENRVFIGVTVDEDPGRDLGSKGQLAHRFFFSPEEVEPL